MLTYAQACGARSKAQAEAAHAEETEALKHKLRCAYFDYPDVS
jgi:hypothetical protein